MSQVLASRESQQILEALGRVFRWRRILLVAILFAVLVPIFIYNQVPAPVYDASTSLVFEEVESPIPDDVFNKTSSEQFLYNRLEEITSPSFAYDIAVRLSADLKARIPKPKNKVSSHGPLEDVADE